MTCLRLSNGQTLKDFCKKNHISYWTMYSRCDRIGMTPDQAISTEAMKKRDIHFVEDNGKVLSLKKACMRYCLNYEGVLTRRTLKSETIQQAFDYYKNSRERRAGKWLRK